MKNSESYEQAFTQIQALGKYASTQAVERRIRVNAALYSRSPASCEQDWQLITVGWTSDEYQDVSHNWLADNTPGIGQRTDRWDRWSGTEQVSLALSLSIEGIISLCAQHSSLSHYPRTLGIVQMVSTDSLMEVATVVDQQPHREPLAAADSLGSTLLRMIDRIEYIPFNDWR